MESKPYEIIANSDEVPFEKWLDIRKSGIGGHDIGAIMGFSKYGTPLSVYLNKTGCDDNTQKKDTDAQYWGKTLESVVADEFTKRTGYAVKKYPYVLRSKKYEWMLGNVDRLFEDESAGLECKTAHANLEKYWVDGNVPENYILQCHHYMILTGIKVWYIASLVGGQAYYHTRIDYNENIGEAIIREGEAFWNMVKQKTPPSAWGQDVDLLSSLFDNPDDTSINLDLSCIQYIQEYRSAQEAEKQAKASKDDAKAKILESIGNHSNATCGDYKITWKQQIKNTVDLDKFKSEYHDIYATCLKSSSTRTLRIK